MSFNKHMHPRNPFYNNPPDFENLAKLYPEFSTYFTTNETTLSNKKLKKINFKDPNVLKALYIVLMKHYFNLNVDLPTNHLIPRIPQRLNYILWIEDLISKPEKANGIDIGCGTSCVFALLISSLNKGWRMTVTDIDDENIQWANKNVGNNKKVLDDRIKILKVKSETIFEDLIDMNDDSFQFDFMMCNPPFFQNETENIGSGNTRKPEKRHMPNSANTQKSFEAIYSEGGEVGFLKKIITESVKIGERIKLYTSMLGKKSSLIELKTYLKENANINNVSDTQFCQGHTMRWGLAWSLNESEKLAQIDYFPKKNTQNKTQVKPLIFKINKDLVINTGTQSDLIFYYEKCKSVMVSSLKLVILEENIKILRIKLGAIERTWLNQRSKRRKEAATLDKPGLHNESILPLIENPTCSTQNIPNSIKNYLITFYFQLKSKNNNDLFLEFYVNDSSLKDTLCQIFECVKNKLENSMK